MGIGKTNKALVAAFQRGYRVTADGSSVIGPRKKALALKTHKTRNNEYKAFSFRDGQIVRTLKVHRLQAYQKFGDKVFTKGFLVRHLDNDSFNNHVDNIELGTGFDNYLDKYRY